MMGCRNCARTVIILTVLAPLFSLVVLGVSHNKVVHPGHINSKTAQQVVGHVKKQSNVITDSHGSLLFDPPLLDFGDCAMSVVWRQKVTVKNNRVSDKPINILSISGSSLHFHCSFVEDKVLEASANTTFEVVFLSREEGFVEDTLYIHTNQGSFPYRIQARGMPNPFQAKPFVNVRIPVNTTFSPLIHLYNPFASALQVLEMFGSSCDLHLEMPLVGEDDPSLDWWLIPPHQSKAIAKVNFLASRAVNVTAFVRIRTNYTAQPHGSLMLPVSLEVTSQPLLFCPQQYLDFGVVDVLDAPRTLKLFVINSGNRPITVQSVTASPLVDGLSIELSAGVKVAPSLTTPTLVALVTLRPGRVSQLRTTSGRIVVQSKNGLLKATVGYHWTVAASYLHYNRTSTQFLATSQLQLPNCRPLTVSNDFALSVDVMNATLSTNAGRYVEIRQFERRILRTREQGTILDLCLVKMPPLQTPFVAQLTLRTNTSARLDIPISVFTGRMTPIWKDNDDNETLGANETDRFVGWLTHGSSKELYMALWNGNPEGVGISLLGWGTNNTNAVLTYLGSESASSPAQFKSRSNNYYGSNLTMATTVRPGSYAVFQVLIHGQDDDDDNNQVALSIHVRTAYETVAVTLRYRTMAGSIRTIPEPLPWSAHFLDPHLTTEVRLNSTLQTPVTVLGFRAPPSLQHKLSFDLYSGGIRAMQSAGIARLAYPLDWHCAQSPLAKLGGSRWNGAADFESTTALYGCYESLVQSLWSQVASVKLVTKEIGFTDMPLRLDVQWPRLAVKRRLHFPLTEMGRRSQMELKLVNPTSNVILAHVVRLDNEDALRELVAKLPSHLTEGIELPSRVQQQQHQPRRSPSPFSLHADATDREEEDENETDVMVYLTPGSQAILTVSFRPMADLKYRSLLVVKNNVTGLELVSVSGQGQSAKFLLANRKPGSNQPLLFDIGEQHLKNCLVGGANSGGTTTSNNNRFHYLLPSVTVKRTFTARNRGQFPITITGFDINHSPCEGYGFRVLQCQPLTLLPNESHSLEVAFTPDFTQTRISRTLRLHSTLGGQQTPLNYTLTATLPDHMLVPCAAVLPRPNWESIFYYASVVVSVFLLLCVITAAALDADRILKTGVVAVVTVVSAQSVPDTEPRGHLLDLRAIGKEAALLPSSSNWSENNGGTTSSTESNCSSNKAKTNNSSSKKSKSKKTQQRPASKGASLSSTAWILSPPSKRNTTPSPTMSSSSVQTPPPSPKPFRFQPPSPTPKAPPPPVIVATTITTTKEETRVFVKPKAKKANKATKTTPSVPTTAPSVPVPVTAPTAKASEPSVSSSTTTKRARSSSVPSNNRKKAPPEVQVPAAPRTATVNATTKPTAIAATIKIPIQAPAVPSVAVPPPPPPPPPPPTAALEKEESVWNKKARIQPKVVATVAAVPNTVTTTTTTTVASSAPVVQQKQQQQQQQQTVRPQPPVGKILPEVRRPEIVQQQQQQEMPLKADHELPKPIGYRPPVNPVTSSNAQTNQWFNLLPSSPPAAAVSSESVAPVVPDVPPTPGNSLNWWPEEHSLFSLNRPQQQPAIEEQRDWFGLRSLASDLTSNNNSSSSSSNDQPTSWFNWPSQQQQQRPLNSFSTASAVPTVITTSSSSNNSRIYSPWSVPHWLQVTQQPQQQQQSDSTPASGGGGHGGESWPAYSQF